MRIKVFQIAPNACIDGVHLDWLVPGFQYDVGTLIGAYLLAEGWAEPAPESPPSTNAEPPFDHEDSPPSNVRREWFPPYYDGPPIALDRRRTRRMR